MEGVVTVISFAILITIVVCLAKFQTDYIDKENQTQDSFKAFKQNHPELKDPTTIQRIKKFLAAKYTIHLMYKELYRLYLRDCDEKGKPALSYTKWKFAYGL